jgi:multiple sugar transport system substrate-binding protein
MKGKILIACVSISALFSIIGCGKRTPAKVNITFAGGGVGAEEEVNREQIRRFEELHPDIKVRYQVMPQSSTQQHDIYVTYLSSADPSIDVYMVDVIWPPEFAAAGWLRALDDLLSDYDKKDFFPAALQACTYKGKTYAIPWFSSVAVLYYRKDLLDKSGLAPPRSWGEFVKCARTIMGKTGKEGFVWQGAQYEGLVCNFLEYLWSNNGGIFDGDGELRLNTEANREALAFMVDLIHRYKISPPGVLNYIEEDCRQLFGNGDVIFMRNWPYAWPLLERADSPTRGKVAIEPLMHGPRSQYGRSCLGGWCLALSGYSRHPDQARRFIQFLTERNQLRERAVKAGQAPVRRSLYEDPVVLRANPIYEKLGVILARAMPRPVTPLYAEISEKLQIYVSQALSDTISPERALRKSHEDIEALFERYGEKP